MQETLLAAWQGLAGFAGRASIRTWLYRIATNRCLNAVRSTRRRPPLTVPPATAERPAPNRAAPVIWLEPCPDVLLDGLADSTPGPEASYEAKEAISLAFVTALQIPGGPLAAARQSLRISPMRRESSTVVALVGEVGDGLLVLTLTGGQISALTRFDNSALPSFGLPRTLPSADPSAPA